MSKKRSRQEMNGSSAPPDAQNYLKKQPQVERRLPRLHGPARRELPVFKYRDTIVSAVKEHQTVVLMGETGSGKSTQVPQFLYDAGLCKGGKVICCTQPRRVAAITVSKRVAEEMGCELGRACGYSVRFDDHTSKSTAIKFATDGVLLREAMEDPLLSSYGVVILDEAHERSLQTDILFGLVRQLQERRKDLRVIVMSATLEVEQFVNFFKDVAQVSVPGRTHPVQMYYAEEPQLDYVDAALTTCLQIHEEEIEGDVLVFLPGRDDIESLALLLGDWLLRLRREALNKQAENEGEEPQSGDGNNQPPAPVMDWLIVKVFAALPQELQLQAFAPTPPKTRKFVLATNIAETSITISGIRYVVDTGLVKQRSAVAGAGMEVLKVVPVSQSQAQQRAGRAGRETSGSCYRLFTEKDFTSLAQFTSPEIERVDVGQVVLQLKVIGVDKVQSFGFLTPPSRKSLVSAMEVLYLLGALDTKGQLTEHGKRVAALPLLPIFSHLLLTSALPAFQCTTEVLDAVSCLSVDNIFYLPTDPDQRRHAAASHRGFASSDGDFPCLAAVLKAYRVEQGKNNKGEHMNGKKSVGGIGWCQQRFLNHRSLSHAVEVRSQLARILQERLHIDPTTSCGAEQQRMLRCVAAGLSLQVAILQQGATGASAAGRGNCYRMARGGREVYLHPSSCIFTKRPLPKCVAYTEVVETSRQYIKNVTVVDQAWLAELAPDVFKKATT